MKLKVMKSSVVTFEITSKVISLQFTEVSNKNLITFLSNYPRRIAVLHTPEQDEYVGVCSM